METDTEELNRLKRDIIALEKKIDENREKTKLSNLKVKDEKIIVKLID
jgi:hypothetical protein